VPLGVRRVGAGAWLVVGDRLQSVAEGQALIAVGLGAAVVGVEPARAQPVGGVERGRVPVDGGPQLASAEDERSGEA